MREITVNQLLRFIDQGRTERVLWIDRLGRGAFVIDVSDPRALPVFRGFEEIEQAKELGLLDDAVEDPWATPTIEDQIPATHRERRDRAWALLLPLLQEQPANFLAEKRGPIVQTVIAGTGADRHTLYRLLRRYWQRGMTPNALLPDYHLCGGRGKDKAASTKKRGRPSVYGIAGINIDKEVRGLFKSVVTRYFAQNGRLNFKEALDLVIRENDSDEGIDEQTGRQVIVPRPIVPKIGQFRYWFEKDNDLFRIERIRRTPRVYDTSMRALLSTSSSEVFGPGSRYQIDATIADVYLVSRYDPKRIVGRPVIYVVIDVFSRMIVGIYVGLEGPSWVGAMMAIANTAADKVEYCRRFGVSITAAEWPCHALPEVLLGDRGEMIGASVETLAKHFHVRIENTAPYRADWKAIVEQRFRLLPAKFKAYMPGYVDTDFRKRGGKDYRLDATLDIDQFTRVIIHCALYYNLHHLYPDYERTAGMIAEGVQAVPIELWEWGLTRRSGILRSFPEDQVKLSLLPTGEATVTASGIVFYGCHYSCTKAIEEHWFERARRGKSWRVRISYDPRCMDDIYLHDDAGRLAFLRCQLMERSDTHRDRTLWEIDQERRDARRLQKEHEPRAIQGRVNLQATLEDIIGEATARKAAQPPDDRSDRAKVGDIRENRRAERRENQRQEAFRMDQPAKPPSPDAGKVVPFPAAPPDDYAKPNIKEILAELNKGSDDAER